ncbi:SWEET sugar transporter [Phytophthora cactorum]|nr:SWEET sugar transporter [Phytophthora cactorum]
MSGHDTAVIVAKVLTIITTIMLRISLMPDFNRWRKNRNTGDMSVMPCVLLYTNCYALLYYAYAIDDMLPLFATSVLGVVVGGSWPTISTNGQTTSEYHEDLRRVFHYLRHSDDLRLPRSCW